MKYDVLAAAATLSDTDLLARLPLLAGQARENTVEMVAHLSELEVRGIHLAEGYGSLFAYCTNALRLSEHEAYNRVVAARLARQSPVILDGLGDGSLNLTTVRLLAPLITAENHREILARAAGRSKREVEALVASLAPQPDVLPRIRRLTVLNQPEMFQDPIAPSTPPPREQVPTPAFEADHANSDSSPVGVEHAGRSPARRAVAPSVHAPTVGQTALAPLSPTRYRLQCTIGEGAHADLRLAQDLLRREIPNGDPGVIIERALALLVAQIAKEKTAATSMPEARRSAKPRPAPPGAPASRHVPAAVRRAVWLRERGQCAFVARRGRRCTERTFLELHHLRPYALGGEATVSNISLRCRRHNTYEAQMDFSPRTLRRTGRTTPPVGVGELALDSASAALK
jgi:hypothetical protein